MQRSIASRRAALTAAGLALVLAGGTGCLGSDEPADTERNADATEFTLTIGVNAIAGGKNSASAKWLEDWLVPQFTADQAAKGRKVTVKIQPSGAGDEEYKSKVSLDLKTGSGADIYSIDGIWVGEFADAGYIKPLDDLLGKEAVDAWDGWSQIPPAVQGLMTYQGKRYGVPLGTDGRVIYFNKKLLAQAGLPENWEPKSWDEIVTAGQAIKAKLPGVTPIQLNAGTAMCEATAMQGFLPLLVGAGQPIWADGKWQGDTPAVRDVLGFYQRVYGEKLGDPVLQQDAKGRDKSFQRFAAGKLAILMEGDYFWRAVVEPKAGIAKMPDRDAVVGYAPIPAKQPGAGINGQDIVSMSGGGGRVINPATKYPKQAWELLQFMNSKQAVIGEMGGSPRVSQRQDVNQEVLAGDPMLTMIATRVLPLTAYRPPLAEYPRVSQALQQATLDVATGKGVDKAIEAYAKALPGIVGAGKVASG